jgi:hypothetical protein
MTDFTADPLSRGSSRIPRVTFGSNHRSLAFVTISTFGLTTNSDRVGDDKRGPVRPNDTRNQHFISRVEQRLNASNPNADARNLRIYSFEVTDRKRYALSLERSNGSSIDRNLSLLDLFSFDVPETGSLRLNFESHFQRHERSIEFNTIEFLSKLDRGITDCSAELIDLFAAKLLNFVRNPFSITKVLNTFPSLGRYDPTDPVLLSTYRRFLVGRKPQQTRLCRELGITDQQYVQWLRTLFMLLVPLADGHTGLFGEMIKTLFQDRRLHVSAFVWIYDNHRCLLSDRGFSQPIEDNPHLSFSFNLRSDAFIDFIFADRDTLMQSELQKGYLFGSWRHAPAKPHINVTVTRNNLEMLARFNRRAIEQCFRRVYCAAKESVFLGVPQGFDETT